MTRKALWLLPASVVAVVASQWRDIARYVKIHQMSSGVPAATGPSPADTPQDAALPDAASPDAASRGDA